MSKNSAEDLLRKYNAGTASEEEKALVETWYARFEDKLPVISRHQVASDQSESWRMLVQEYPSKPALRLWSGIAAAAIILLTLSIGLLFYRTKNINQNAVKISYINQERPRGGDKVVLTLANGKKISLTEAKNGELAEQSGIKITKTADGQLVYSTTGRSGASEPLSYNTIEIPKGQQYQLNLPDGTLVWLNAASTLRYPARFSGKERRVELSGEAYFEVAKNKSMPFRVQSGKREVEVLGTHFNVNSYPDEKIMETTLLEGSVKVTDQTSQVSKTIVPGEQAQLFADHSISVRNADTQKITAWKNGDFFFKDDDLPYILRQVSRWYDVDIVYQGAIPVSKFAGQASRKITLTQMMDIIKVSGVQVSLKNKTLFIQASQ